MIAETPSELEKALPPGQSRLGDGLRSVVRNGAWLLGASWLATLLRLVYVAILARWLGPEGFGLISTLQSTYLAVLATATAGLPAFLSKTRSERGDLRGMLGEALSVQGAGLLACALAFVALAAGSGASGTEWLLIGLFAGALVLRGLSIAVADVFTAHEDSAMVLRLVGSFRFMEVLAGTCVLWLGGGLIGVALVHLASWLAEAVTGFWLMRRRVGPLGGLSLDLAGIAGPLFGVGIALAAGHWIRSAPLVLVRYSEAAGDMIGQFALAWNAALMLATLTVTVLTAAFPVLGRAHQRADGKDVRYLDFCVRYGLLAGAAAGLVAYAMGGVLMHAIGGGDYGAAEAVFQVAACVIGPVAASFAVDQILYLKGRLGWLTAVNALAVLALVAGFVPVFSAYGAPAAAGLTLAVVLAGLVVKLLVLHRLAEVKALTALARPGLVWAVVAGTAWLAAPLGLWLQLGVAGAALIATSFATGTVRLTEWRGGLNALMARQPA